MLERTCTGPYLLQRRPDYGLPHVRTELQKRLVIPSLAEAAVGNGSLRDEDEPFGAVEALDAGVQVEVG